MESSIRVITPEEAGRILDGIYSGQRSVRESVVDRYAEMMSRGEWHDGVSAIIFDDKGNLIDGQHRLRAQVKSGATVAYCVIAGVPTHSYEVIDSGARRSLGDKAGVSSNEAAIGGALCAYMAGAPIKACMKSYKSGTSTYVTEPEIIRFCSEHRDEIRSIRRTYDSIRANVGRMSTKAFATYYAAARERFGGHVDAFCRELALWDSGCKQAVACVKALQGGSTGKAKAQDEQFAILIRATEQYVNGFVPKMPTKANLTDAMAEKYRRSDAPARLPLFDVIEGGK